MRLAGQCREASALFHLINPSFDAMQNCEAACHSMSGDADSPVKEGGASNGGSEVRDSV